MLLVSATDSAEYIYKCTVYVTMCEYEWLFFVVFWTLVSSPGNKRFEANEGEMKSSSHENWADCPCSNYWLTMSCNGAASLLPLHWPHSLAFLCTQAFTASSISSLKWKQWKSGNEALQIISGLDLEPEYFYWGWNQNAPTGAGIGIVPLHGLEPKWSHWSWNWNSSTAWAGTKMLPLELELE